MTVYDDEKQVSGTVTKVYSASPKFSAGELRLDGGVRSRFAAKAFLKVGQFVTLKGNHVLDPKYGEQFAADEVSVEMPNTPGAVADWLVSHGNISSGRAYDLLCEFGVNVGELCDTTPETVAIQAKMPIETVREIGRVWVAERDRLAVGASLAGYGLTQNQIEALTARFGSTAAEILRTNPYMLLFELHGFAFKRVDDIARRVGFPMDSPERHSAAVAFVVRQKRDENGSTVVHAATAHEEAANLIGGIGADVELLAKMADAGRLAVANGKVKMVGDNYYTTPRALRTETAVWRELSTSRRPNPFIHGDPDKVAANYPTVRVNGVEVALDDSQKAAIRSVAANRITVITGGAGSGKTTVTRAVVKMFDDADATVMLAAPTGKAADRMSKVIGRDASTIHRLLEYGPGLERENGTVGSFGFQRDADNPLPPGLIVIDEVSMLDSDLTYALFQAVTDEHCVVLVGDPNQLPPVGPGAFLRDVIRHDLAPVAKLGKCHRQAGPLKANSAAVLDGRIEPTVVEGNPSPWMVHQQLTAAGPEKFLATLFEKYLPEWGFDPVTQVQFMTAKHAGPVGTTYLNRVVQRLNQKRLGRIIPAPDVADTRRTPLMVGDKVIHTRNNYTLNVMNGETGIVEGLSPLVVGFPEKTVIYPRGNEEEVSLGYVLTPHKMQGSEIPCAVVFVPKTHGFMQHRHWLYTAATRATRAAILIGDADGLRQAAARVEMNNRQTLLATYAEYPDLRPKG